MVVGVLWHVAHREHLVRIGSHCVCLMVFLLDGRAGALLSDDAMLHREEKDEVSLPGDRWERDLDVGC